MPGVTQQRWREFRDLEKILERLEAPPIVRIYRPLVVHARAPDENTEPCKCGCGSTTARVVAVHDHIDMLLETRTGRRVFRNPETEDLFADPDSYRLIELPLRCSESQLPIVLDVREGVNRGRQRKVLGAFGGNRSGKTSLVCGEIALDVILLQGGPGSKFLFVSPTLEKTSVMINKLLRGDSAGSRRIQPLIPRELVYQNIEGQVRADGTKAILVDGTELHFRHGGRDGENFKGLAVIAFFFDEVCEVKKIGNWHVAMNRTMDSGGTLYFASTPVAGHWARSEILGPGSRLATAEAANDIVYTELSCWDNPWIRESEIQRVISALNDQRLIDRDVHGKWIPEGVRLWEFWDSDRLGFRGSWKPEDHGWVDITEHVMRQTFFDTEAKTDEVLGVDFNVRPMSVVSIKIVIRPGADREDPKNWHVWVPHEHVRDGGLVKLLERVESGYAARLLALPADHYENRAAVCDATGAQSNAAIAAVHGIEKQGGTPVRFLRAMGWDARPVARSRNGRPMNPAVIDSIELGNKLMREGRVHVHLERCPKLVEGFETQERTADGRIDKEPNKHSDKISGPSDGWRYGIWKLMARHVEGVRRLAA